MTYRVNEIFYSLQGEGAQSGRPAVFCRFVGCNLWSGREVDRATATCRFCDTDFVHVGPDGGEFETADDLAEAVVGRWEGVDARPYVILTGGEPSLQADAGLIQSLQARGAIVAIETNGTRPLPPGLDWVCVSPKAGTDLVVRRGDELKLVFPQAELEPAELRDLEFSFRFLQPMDGPDLERNTTLAVDYCMRHPEWRLSVQAHKVLGVR